MWRPERRSVKKLESGGEKWAAKSNIGGARRANRRRKLSAYEVKCERKKTEEKDATAQHHVPQQLRCGTGAKS